MTDTRTAFDVLDDWGWPWPCERCGTEKDAITAVGSRQLCTKCREALDLCALCAAPTMYGEFFCPECELIHALSADDERELAKWVEPT